jgi:hypothetical protein
MRAAIFSAMNSAARPRWNAGLALAALLAAPILGGWLGGWPAGFADFPPLEHQDPGHPIFSWPVFTFYAVLSLLAAAILVQPARFGFRVTPASPRPVVRHPYPVWFWIGLALNILSWIAAWMRPPALGRLNDHTFFPIWLGYILMMDGLVQRRAGTSLLRRSPLTFALLFPVSSVTWWYFEFLNRFVQNWWYEGIVDFTAWRYIGHATLCFSTVLPAVWETAEWLATRPWFQRAYAHGPALEETGRDSGATGILLGAAGLAALAAAPAFLYPLTWLAPLAVLAGALRRMGIQSPVSPIRHGDYRPTCILAVAGLVCGVFWELWNFGSLPRWHYNVPFVNRFHIFEMPVVGFAGYLPFGIYCGCAWLLARAVLPEKWRPLTESEPAGLQ